MMKKNQKGTDLSTPTKNGNFFSVNEARKTSSKSIEGSYVKYSIHYSPLSKYPGECVISRSIDHTSHQVTDYHGRN